MTRATLYLLCGKMAAGKSTLATAMAQQKGCALMVEDQLLEGLYPGEISDLASYLKYSSLLKTTLQPVIVSLLRSGASLVLDFPANTVDQRRWLLALAQQAGVSHELHYLALTDQDCKRQLARRAAANPARRRTDTEQMYNAVTRYFQPPTADEPLTLIVHNRTR